jgi:hypothetical protein
MNNTPYYGLFKFLEGPVPLGVFGAVIAVSTTPVAATVANAYSVTCSVSNITITLPDAFVSRGNQITILKADATAYKVIVTPTGANTVAGDTSLIISFKNSSVTLTSDGSNWVIT